MIKDEDSGHIEREREFHARRYSVDEGYRSEARFYRALHGLDRDFSQKILELGRNAEVLDYGCGTGFRAIELARSMVPKSIHGIDISGTAVDLASSHSEGLVPRPTFQVDNCEHTTLPNERFDLIYGNGIIHHLDTGRAAGEMSRLLREGGNIVFYEPLGTNIVINLYRRLTPGSRSVDEHPLVDADLDILRDQFQRIQFTYYGFFTLVTMPFYKNPKRSHVFRLASWLDRHVLNHVPFARYLAWAVLIQGEKGSASAKPSQPSIRV
jgi:SAM-dependent methyltransferase